MSAKKNRSPANDSAMSRKERRAAEREARKAGRGSSSSTGGSRFSVPVITGGAIVIGVIVVLALVVFSGGLSDDGQTVTAAELPAPAEDLRVGRSLGDPNAAVKIDVFEDPQCSHCGRFTKQIEPLLIAGPISDGEVFLTYRDMAILGPASAEAAAAMRVAEELDGKFWDYHNLVYHNQGSSGAFTADGLGDMAELVDIDREAFMAELDDPKYLALVQAETDEGQRLGVNSTPTLVINGVIAPGVPEWDALRVQIADAASAADTAA